MAEYEYKKTAITNENFTLLGRLVSSVKFLAIIAEFQRDKPLIRN